MKPAGTPQRANSSSCGRFAAMIVTSTLLMYAWTYLNSYSIGHVSFSETRAYMALPAYISSMNESITSAETKALIEDLESGADTRTER